MYGTIDHWGHWVRGRWAGGEPPPWEPPELAFEVNRMPKGYREGSVFAVSLLVDAAGRANGSTAADPKVGAGFAAVLCTQASADPSTPARDAAGNPVESA